MRPTFMGFESAKKAIFVNQKSLDIVGNNLSNRDTIGYTRQRVDRAAVAPSSYSSRVATSRVGLAGQGVDALGVSQMRDSFLDKRFREEYSKSSYHSQAASVLDDIQNALVDGKDLTDESGLYGAISQLSKTLNDFIGEPTMQTQANLVLSSFKNITQVLRQMDNNLSKVAIQQQEDLYSNVEDVKDIASQIAHLNKMIGEDATVLTDPGNEYFRPNELLDERNVLLDKLASYGDINVTQLANGKVNVSLGGHPIVTENKYETLNVSTNPSDNTVLVQWTSTGENFSPNSGSILASMHFINGRGNNVQSSSEEPYQGIPYYRDQLDTFAGALAELANKTLPELGTDGKPKTDADGNIVYKTLLGAKGPDGSYISGPITAENISISKEWTEGGAGYFIFDENNAVEDYAMQMMNNLTKGTFTFESYGEKFEGTFADFEVNFVSKLGTDLAFHNGRQESYAMAADDFLDRRDEVSGVSEDEETADMMKFQKSYEAASRFMTVLDDLLDIIINRTGRAGL